VSRMLFVNLAVADVERSKTFFTGLGFELNPQFSSDTTACLIVNDQCSILIHEPSRFTDFTTKAIADSATTTEAILAFSAESRAEVDTLADQALASGGSPANEPQDHGFMYGRSFQDPDGHVVELIWMDPTAMPPS